MNTPIPTADAIRICQQIAPQKVARWWNPLNWQCRGCVRFSASIEQRCFAAPDNRGCRFVNQAWDREQQAA